MIAVFTQLRIMSGVFTGCLLEHLTTPNLELGKLVMLVIKGVIDLRGEMQSPVCGKAASQQINKCSLELSAMHVRTLA